MVDGFPDYYNDQIWDELVKIVVDGVRRDTTRFDVHVMAAD